MAMPPAEQMTASLAPCETTRLEAHVRNRLGRRVRELRVIVHGPGLILRGTARTYYAKQLTQHVVMEVSALPILANEIEVKQAAEWSA
jgi:hypothetical protein